MQQFTASSQSSGEVYSSTNSYLSVTQQTASTASAYPPVPSFAASPTQSSLLGDAEQFYEGEAKELYNSALTFAESYLSHPDIADVLTPLASTLTSYSSDVPAPLATYNTSMQQVAAEVMSKVQLGAALISPIGDALDALGVFGIFADADVLASESSILFRTESGSSGLLDGTEPITPELVTAMQAKGRVINIAVAGSDDYKYLESMGAEASINTGIPNHILIKEDANKSTLIEEFLHGTQNRIGIVDRLGSQGAEVHVKDFMLRHSKLIGLNNLADIKLLEQLHFEEVERVNQINQWRFNQ